ncbi:nicotinate-nucleotide--dimethylbenzimidazole phosphoribosyltransferase [Streptomyces monomycini]|uniref:nicotinate-nucleotide--dimethylbenzimidazole phosphoribosyltransferase n=1 Tax=Streptomyces monomycini TaxID=371720 RepID=UPI0004AA7244|nr:nicotinate-nucleotide--dimethylbenzimidazole phosphoribosyltransferase [Streptomyces monomycini]
MTDTGQVPGEGLPENAGGQPGQPQPAAVPPPAEAGPTQPPGTPQAPDAYTFPDPADAGTEDDDLLLMPGAQGAWGSEQQHHQHHQSQFPQQAQPSQAAPQQTVPEQAGPYDSAPLGAMAYEPVPPEAGDHESGGRDSGSVDLGGVRVPPPAAPQQAPVPPRRPLHMGPPVPDASGGVVRSLADRGPAGAPPSTPVRGNPGPPTTGPEYLDVEEGAQQPEAPAAAAAPAAQQAPAEAYAAPGSAPLPGPQLGEIPVQMPAQVPSWDSAPAQAAPVAPVAAQAAAAVQAVPDAATAVGAVPAPEAVETPVETPVASPVPDAAAAAESVDRGAEEAAGAGVTSAEMTAETADVTAETAEVQSEVAGAVAPEAQPEGVREGAEGAPEAASEETAPEGSAPQADADGSEQAAEAVAGEPVAAEAVTGEPVVAEQQAPADPAASADQAAPVEQPVPAEQPAPEAEGAQPMEPVQDVTAAGGTTHATGTADGAQPADPAQVPQPIQVAEEAPAAPAGTPAAAQETAAPAAGPAESAAEAEDAPAVTATDAPGAEQPVAPVEAEAVPAEDPNAVEQAPAVPEQHQVVAEQEQAVAPVTGVPQETAAPAEEPQPQAADAAPGAPEAVAGQQPADGPEAAPAADAQDPAAEAAPTDAEQAPASQEQQAPEARSPEETARAAGQAPAAPVAEETQAPAAEAVRAGAPEGDDQPAPEQDASELVQLGDDQDGDDQDGPNTVHAPDTTATPTDAPQEQPTEAPAAETGTDTGPEAAAKPESVPAAPAAPTTPPATGYDDSERAAVHRVMRERRDIRNGFRPDPIPNEVLLRVLEAAHTAPSVGHSQPWDFVVIRSQETRERMHQLASAQREAYAKSLPKARAKQFRELKIEAILETPVNIVVTADSTRGGRHTLGRHTQPQMAPYSSALAVENLWLAARAEGLGVGWVSFFDEREMVRELGLPDHLEVVAYLCVGFVDEFPDEPELMQAGWAKRRPLSWVVHEETYGRRALPGEAPADLLQETLQGIRPLDAKALGEAWERQKRMTKPAGALGMLEIISAQLCGLSRKCPPPIPEPAAVAVFAGDHGVHAQGVTPWPQEVTAQMVANFLGGGAVCNAFANQVGAEVCVVDVGVAADLPTTPGLLPRKIRPGTADFTAGPAMSHEEVLRALEVGIETARDLVAAGNKALITGEMGIANTTTSAALISVYTETDPGEVTGRGTGINDETHARKVDVVRRGLELHRPDPADPIGVLAAVGGLEHAAMAGLILGGASLRTPVILDGVSAGAAALVARAIAPEALAACIAGHRSAEPGHVAALNKLGLRPLVDLDLRLGEGTGALLALPVVQSAARAMHEVATFDSAGVTEKS